MAHHAIGDGPQPRRSSHRGSGAFAVQRASAIVLIPLTVWFLVALVARSGSDFDQMAGWLATPVNAFLLGVLVTAGAAHMRVGITDVLVDYTEGGVRQALKILNLLTALGVVGATWWSLYHLVF